MSRFPLSPSPKFWCKWIHVRFGIGAGQRRGAKEISLKGRGRRVGACRSGQGWGRVRNDLRSENWRGKIRVPRRDAFPCSCRVRPVAGSSCKPFRAVLRSLMQFARLLSVYFHPNLARYDIRDWLIVQFLTCKSIIVFFRILPGVLFGDELCITFFSSNLTIVLCTFSARAHF